MTNRLAIIIAGLIAALFLADYVYFGWNLPVVLGKKLTLLTEYIAFWR